LDELVRRCLRFPNELLAIHVGQSNAQPRRRGPRQSGVTTRTPKGFPETADLDLAGREM
jgi:hypothetical protein